MNPHSESYQVVAFPKLRRMLAMTYRSVRRVNKVHGLIEVDVTEARRLLQDVKERTGESLSFTAFIIACLARAVGENISLDACRKRASKLVLFDAVDVVTPIERDIEGRRQPIMYIVRSANTKGVREITREIRTAQSAAVERTWEGFQAERWLALVPMIVLRGLWALFWWARGRFPGLQKKLRRNTGCDTEGVLRWAACPHCLPG